MRAFLAAFFAGLCLLGAQADAAPCPPPPDAQPFDVAVQGASGQPLPLVWSDPWPAAHDCGGGTWLILAMPERVRFSGEGFFALAPGERAPFDIGFAPQSLRVVIPLHIATEGSFDILPYHIGTFALDWALVHVPVTDGVAGEAQIHAGPGLAVDIRPGPPEIVVQDPFDTATPQEVILSNAGEHRIEIYDHHYRVLDVESGALVHAGEGCRPTFSPSSRFMHVFTDTPCTRSPEAGDMHTDLLLVDLWTATSVQLTDPGVWSVRGSVISSVNWSPGDGFLMLAFHGDGALGVHQTLRDRPLVIGQAGDYCHRCNADLMGKAVIEPENAIIASAGTGPRLTRSSLLFTQGLAFASHEPWEDPDATPHPALLPHRLLPPPYDRGMATAPEWWRDTALFDLLGTTRASFADGLRFGWIGGRDLPPVDLVAHAVQPTATRRAAASADENLAARGGEAIQRSASVARSTRLQRRVQALGLTLRSAPTIPHARLQIGDHAPDAPDSEVLGGFRVTLDIGATLRRHGLASAETAAAVDALWLEVLEEHDLCTAFMPVSQAELWMLRRPGESTALLRYACGDPDGGTVGALIRIDLDNHGATWRSLAMSGSDWEAEEDHFYVWDGHPDWTSPHAELRLFALSGSLVAVASRDRRISLLDLRSSTPVVAIAESALRDLPDLVALTEDGAHLFEAGPDGRFNLYARESGAIVLSGFYLDDEIVAFDNALNFDATPEGARYVQLRFPGARHLYGLDQLDAAYRAEGVVTSILSGAPLPAPPTPSLPPRLFDLAIEGVTLRASVEADGDLAEVTLYRDGIAVARQALSGNRAAITLALPPLPETRGFALQARDAQGLTSRAAVIPWQATGPARGRLFALAVGTDIHDDPAISELGFATADASGLITALSEGASDYYAETRTWPPIQDSASLATELPAALAALTAEMTPDDTLFLHLAGHGFVDADGSLRLADRATRLDDLAGTALAFDQVVALLADVPGRVVIFLDVCHSGAAGAGTNDDAVAALLAEGRAVAVLAASKGRQFSLESAGLGGGAFTSAVIRALTDPAADLDGNGTLELAELYAAVKSDVVLTTDGEQTPWIARSGFVGEVPLF